jgi:hypothetical protein
MDCVAASDAVAFNNCNNFRICTAAGPSPRRSGFPCNGYWQSVDLLPFPAGLGERSRAAIVQIADAAPPYGGISVRGNGETASPFLGFWQILVHKR